MSYDIHEIAAYLKLQQHPTAQRLYNQLAEEFGYNITNQELKKQIDAFLAEEQKIYSLRNVISKQEAMILLNRETKKFRIKLEKMYKISEEEKVSAREVIERMGNRLVEEVLGVKLYDFQIKTPEKKRTTKKATK